MEVRASTATGDISVAVALALLDTTVTEVSKCHCQITHIHLIHSFIHFNIHVKKLPF